MDDTRSVIRVPYFVSTYGNFLNNLYIIRFMYHTIFKYLQWFFSFSPCPIPSRYLHLPSRILRHPLSTNLIEVILPLQTRLKTPSLPQPVRD